MNGNGLVNEADSSICRSRAGSVLPKLPPPQMAAGGEGPGGAALLTPAELAPVVTEAITEWAAAGLPARDIAKLRQTTVRITDLPAGYLGAASIGGSTIELSADAAGYGWYTGSSPSINTALARPAKARLRSAGSAIPYGREDLLTVVMHEFGHALGLEDVEATEFPTDLMAKTLATVVRRLPSAEDVARVLAAESHLAASNSTRFTSETGRAIPATFGGPGGGKSHTLHSLGQAPIPIRTLAQNQPAQRPAWHPRLLLYHRFPPRRAGGDQVKPPG
jgi:hypothetical protein